MISHCFITSIHSANMIEIVSGDVLVEPHILSIGCVEERFLRVSSKGAEEVCTRTYRDLCSEDEAAEIEQMLKWVVLRFRFRDGARYRHGREHTEEKNKLPHREVF
ncbi:hypothetical protein AVEN_181715-1 [Araneus ventricosus]|uniref:Uncharacterized protein n=1 Tax=Araneus ventricosus TaxID=182803 RepID=A0A4Y2EBC8_ARAVE|nr:hypothetical protein AVEN_181715-1 [Araneus ventricosus]